LDVTPIIYGPGSGLRREERRRTGGMEVGEL
jgi:hypothetical protein